MGCKVTWKPVNESWTTVELIKHLELALSLCSSTDVILATSEGREKFLPFTEYSALQCDNCGAICIEADQFLVHTLKCRFDEAHLILYRRLGMIPRSVQRILNRKWERSSSMVGRALQNNPELCVLTPVESPLAPFMLSGVTVSTSEPKCKHTYAKTMVEGPCVKSVPIYFCVRAVRRRFEEMEKYAEQKRAKRRYKALAKSLKSFRIDVQDLLEFPPKDPEVAHLLHQATGIPIGAAIIPAKRIHLRVPMFSFSDLRFYFPPSSSTLPAISRRRSVRVPTSEEEKPKVSCDNVMVRASFGVLQSEEKPPTLPSGGSFGNSSRKTGMKRKCYETLAV